MRLFLLIAFISCTVGMHAQSLYDMPAGTKSRMSSFENPNGVKGNGGKTNKTAKGNAFEVMKGGETKTLLAINGQGTIQRIWLTIDQNPVKLRSLRLQCYWDNDQKPAVDVPLGDFFGYNLGKPVAFESAMLSSGEGRSFNCYIPMPFRKAARMVLINEGQEPVKLFYDVDFVVQEITATALYFHAYWTRESASKIGDDFLVLPRVNGKGRFLGLTAAVITDSSYAQSWWGEGEVKMYMDGDTDHPTINGTGAEDYIGTAWGLGTFINQYQGCTVANDTTGEFNFYRWHIPDQVYFYKDLRVTLQQIGGWSKDKVKELYQKGAKLQPVTIDGPGGFVRLLEMVNPPRITDEDFPDGWVNFYRVDDYSAVSYFYLDRTSSTLPALAAVETRIKKINSK